MCSEEGDSGTAGLAVGVGGVSLLDCRALEVNIDFSKLNKSRILLMFITKKPICQSAPLISSIFITSGK